MSEPPWNEEVGAWVDKADADLRSARILLRAQPPEDGTGAFHCQQAVEKYLKALLIHRSVIPPYTHDLVALLALPALRDEQLAHFKEEVRLLTPFAVRIRYPAGLEIQGEEERERILASTERICAAVRERLLR